MAVLLIQMPFSPVYTPSIGLSLLKASLDAAGIECHIEYYNVEFAARLGVDRYTWIAEHAPGDILLGDQIFATRLDGSGIDVDCLRSLVKGSDRPGPARFPPEIINGFEEFAATARVYLDEKLESTAWRRYDLVGISTAFQITPALAMARRIKSLSEPPPVILGGAYCQGSVAEDLHRSFSFVDYVCRGDGEDLIVALAYDLAEHSLDPPRIPGLVWRDGNATRCNNHQPRSLPASSDGRGSRAPTGISDDEDAGASERLGHPLDSLAPPRYDDWLDQLGACGVVEPDEMMLPIETSRGCWYGEHGRCIFCGLNDDRIAYRRKSPARVLGPARVLDEFRDIRRYGVRQVFAVDNVLDHRFFDTVLPELEELDHDLKLHYCTRANLSREQVGLLRKSGFVSIQPGIESLSTPTLRLMGKGVTAMQNVRLLRYAAEVELGAIWNLMHGFPGESPAEYAAMADLIPALSHLQPPSRDRSPLWIQRFSPLFDDRETAGLLEVTPVPAYYDVLPLDCEEVAPLAYFFTFDYASHPNPDDYVSPMVEAVRRWRADQGQAAFISFEHRDALHLADTRNAATQPRAELRGLERRLYEACIHGTGLRSLARELGRSPAELEPMLESFVVHRWVSKLDDRYLALAVPMDRQLPAGLPLTLAESVLIGSYCARMTRLSQGRWLDNRFRDAPNGQRRVRSTAGTEIIGLRKRR